jgi:hypothetical protein
MSPASYLTAPPRVAAVNCTSADLYDPRVVWAALAFCLLAVLGSIGYAAARAWRLWKTARAISGRAVDAVGHVTASAAAAERHAVLLTAGTERLSIAVARLQSSLEELAVIRSAAAEPRDLLASIRGLVPRK